MGPGFESLIVHQSKKNTPSVCFLLLSGHQGEKPAYYPGFVRTSKLDNLYFFIKSVASDALAKAKPPISSTSKYPPLEVGLYFALKGVIPAGT